MVTYCSRSDCKAGALSQKQAETTMKLLGNPFCPEHASEESAKSAEAGMSARDKVLAFLHREGFKETEKDFYKDNSDIAVDVREFEPIIGVILNGKLETEGHGVLRVMDIRNTIEGLLKKKIPAPKPEVCIKCGRKADIVCIRPSGICQVCEQAMLEPAEKPKPAEVVAPEKTEHRPTAFIPMRMVTPQGTYIKGLVPMMKEIGKIKIGTKGEVKTSTKGTQYRPPVKIDHFEIVSVLRDDKGNLIPDPIMKELGENPKELDIFLLYNDETLNFTTRYNEYKGGKCQCSGDGVKARLNNGDEIECNPETCKVFKEKRCKPNGILSVILTKSPRLGGVYKFRTTSYNSIRSVLSSLFFIKSLTGGVLAMIPLKLTVSPMTVQPKDSTTSQTIYVVNIEFRGTMEQLLEKTVEVSKYQSMMRANIKQLEATARASLAIPESEEESKEIQAEFYPEKLEEVKS